MTFVLLYHDIVASEAAAVGFPGPLAGRYKVSLELFTRHLDAIVETEAEIGLLHGSRYLPQAALSFDDGGASALVAADELERRGWLGHFLVTTGRIGKRGFLDGAGLVELSQRGHIIGSHSHSHPTYFGKLAPAEIAREWHQSRTVLGDLLGEVPATASVPGGYLSPAVVAGAADAGYEILMTSEPVARARAHGRLSVVGRYTIRSGTPPQLAAAYARGRIIPRAGLWLAWNAKQRAKRLSSHGFEALRRRRGTAA